MSTTLKSAEEWFNELQLDPLGVISVTFKQDIQYIDFIKQIQLNAYKAGMTEAAYIIIDQANEVWRGAHMNTNSSCGTLRHLILSARDKKETL